MVDLYIHQASTVIETLTEKRMQSNVALFVVALVIVALTHVWSSFSDNSH